MTSNDVTFGGVRLMNGDCLERMKEIADGSVDAIICDPPFGTALQRIVEAHCIRTT